MLHLGRLTVRPRLLAALMVATIPVAIGLALAGTALAQWQTAPNGQLSAPMSPPCSGTTCTADHLSFILAPARLGTVALGTIEVAVKDASGATVTNDVRDVQLSINQNSGSFNCTGGQNQNTVSGVATFSGCTETTDASHYIITATDVTSAVTPLASTHTGMFAVLSGPVSHIEPVWWCNAASCPVPPPMAEAGQPFPYVALAILVDAQGRVVSSQYTSTISLAITSGTGVSGAALSCTNGTTITVNGGYAGFEGCSIDTAGTGYSLTVTAVTSGGTFTGLIGYPTTFDVFSAGTPTQLLFTSHPPVYTGSSLGTITVAVADAGGATILGDTRNVELQLWQQASNTQPPQTVTLACTGGTTVAAVNGVATFTGCTAPVPGSGYYLVAYDPTSGLQGESPQFTVVTTTQMAFTGYPPTPTTTDLGTGTITVALEDANGATVTADARTVTLSTNQNNGSFSCSGGLSEAAVNGVATFTGCTQTTIANGYTLTASATGLPDATGSSFDVTSGPATQIHLWWMIPVGSPAGTWGVGMPFSWQPGVEIEDAQGQTVTSDSSTQVTLSLTSAPSGGTLTCTGGPTMTVTAGWADYSGCSVNVAGAYTLTATSSPQGWTYSRTFTATGPGTPAQLAFTAFPPATTYASLGTIKVAVEDAYDTLITSDTRSIELQLWQGANNFQTQQQVTLSCSGGTTVAAASGVATFTGCTAPAPGTEYFLYARDPSGSIPFGTSSDVFTVIAPPSGGGGGVAPATPQIALAVSASPSSLTGSGSVTYTYTVTNPGSLTLSGVAVSDTACTPAYVAGDTNKDTLLEPGETWTYSCTATLAATTTDAAKASGTNNGTTVSATASATVTVNAAPTLTPVSLTDGIAAGVDRGTSGFGTTSLVVLPDHYVTVLGRTSPNLAGSLVEIWVRSKTGDWHRLTSRLVAADGTVHYFARVNGWTAYWLKFAGDSTHAPAASHGRIATSKS